MTPDGNGPDDGGPDGGGPIQLQNPHRRGQGQGQGQGRGGMMGGSGYGPMMGGPGAMMAPPPVSMFADERFLFIVRGDTLMQFDKKSLTLLKSVELPRPLPPVQLDANPQMRSRTSPPLLRRNGVRPQPDGAGF